MNEKDLKKLVGVQERIVKLREKIHQDIVRHNKMVVEELRPLSEDLLHNTLYKHEGATYRRGRVFSQLEYNDYGLGVKAEGLAFVRKIVEAPDVPDTHGEGREESTESES
jgi:hypothetical protein